MRNAIVAAAVFFGISANAKPVTIAVIDTGFTQPAGYPAPNFCKYGHADLTENNAAVNQIPEDTHGHGTNIVYLIEEQLKNISKTSYCIVVMKYWKKGASGARAVQNTVAALKRAKNMKVGYINYSSFGEASSEEERKTVRSLLDDNIVLVAAAGNEGSEIISEKESAWRKIACDSIECKKQKKTLGYPANYDSRVIVVGNLTEDGVKNSSSNYGERVNVWEMGTSVNGGGIVLTGTSQATAIHTGKLVKNQIQGAK